MSSMPPMSRAAPSSPPPSTSTPRSPATLEEGRAVALSTPLGDDVLLLRRMTFRDELGRPFELELEMSSDDHEIALDDVLGEKLTVGLVLQDSGERHFNGHVSRFAYAGSEGRRAFYRATVRPWLWLLTRTADCRIFQNRTVPDIVKQVFRDNGFTDFTEQLAASHRPREYCVQYRETDFDFVSRLLEQEGIYYYFRHENGKHTMVLADSPDAHELIEGYERVPYLPPEGADREEREHVGEWQLAREVQPGAYSLDDFDFRRPRAGLRVTSSAPREHAAGAFEIYDYPGEYVDAEEGDARARARLQELHAGYERSRGSGNARGLSAGGLFELTGHPRDDQNREYLIVSTECELESDEFESATGTGTPGFLFSTRLAAIPSRTAYRSPRTTPKPAVRGPQTAIVVGPDGQEIWADELGRVKVQFHWDRYGKADDESSCWIRVAQAWAGKKSGALFVPRIGHEVIVEFLEGDPDRPIITGQVYNGLNRPPYAPDQHGTMTTVKSLSSKGGEGFNEIRFEDRKDDEQVFVHAQKNLDVRVRNDRFETVCRNRHLVVDKDKKEHVKNQRHELVDSHHHEKVGGDRHLQVVGKQAVAVDESLSLTVSGDVHEVFKGDQATQVSGDLYIKASNIVLEASTNITVKVGSSFVAIEAGGIKIGTSGQVTVEGGSSMTVKGTTGLNLESPAVTVVKGSVVKLN